MIKIYLEGAESTGKSSLAEELANFFHAEFLPEYGRIYVERHWGKFGYDDIELIAKTQTQLEKAYETSGTELLFVDVSLINTRQWFIEEYNKYPEWLDEQISGYKNDFFLLCYTDLEWKADNVRVNPDEKRIFLQEAYKKVIQQNDIPFAEVKGLGEERIKRAIDKVKEVVGY